MLLFMNHYPFFYGIITVTCRHPTEKSPPAILDSSALTKLDEVPEGFENSEGLP